MNANGSDKDIFLSRHSSVADEWSVDPNGSFISPEESIHSEQILLFDDIINNGNIDVTIKFLHQIEGKRQRSLEASIVFRYTDRRRYYYTGVGVYGAKFGIAKATPGSRYISIGNVGNNTSLKVGNSEYRISVDFHASRIRLFENGVLQMLSNDEEHKLGQWGFKTWNCRAQFTNILVKRAKPRAFIVMPFSNQLDFVYRVIATTLIEYGIQPRRGDQISRTRPIIDDLKDEIANADLVLVDFTGKNPNVYYEAGLADAWKKDWIILAQSIDDLTFDVRHIRTIHYSNAMGADITLRFNLEQSLEALGYQKLSAKVP